MEKKNALTQSRIEPSLKARLDAIHERHSTNDGEVIRRLLAAWCTYVEAHDAVRWPVVVIDAAALADSQGMLLATAEDSPNAVAGAIDALNIVQERLRALQDRKQVSGPED